jgi:Xaa-Pro dipeptidase
MKAKARPSWGRGHADVAIRTAYAENPRVTREVPETREARMRRRGFVARSTLGAAAMAAFGPAHAVADPSAGESGELPGPIARLRRQSPEPEPIGEPERKERRAKAQRLMEERGIAAMFIEPGPNLDYFADVSWGRSERLFGLLLPRRGDGVIISPSFEKERAALGVKDRFEIRAWQEDESPYDLIVQTVRAAGLDSGGLAMDPAARVFAWTGLAGAAGSRFDVVTAAPIVEQTRGVKSAHEIEIMRYANQVTLQAYDAAFATMKPGMTQEQLSANVSAAMTRLGYEGGALVLFGESSAYPHGAPNPAPLSEGSVVLIDGGLKVHGYQSDDTRTVSFAKPDAEAQRAFDVVREAQQAALAAAAPGRPAGSVDAAARAVIDRAGFGPGYRLFTHRLGHGIGLEYHEWPYLVKDSAVELRPGMTFSDEPGIYQYGKFGMRLEDIMAITDTGAELLTEPATSLEYSAA